MKLAEVPGFPGHFAREDGAVLGKRGRPLAAWVDDEGYHHVNLQRPDRSGQTRIAVHRAVALAFHGPAPHLRAEVRHIDGSRDNNTPWNLAWGTHSENLEDRRRHGTAPFGERHGMAKITYAIATRIREAVASGRVHREVAAQFGVSKGLVSLIVNHKIWKEPANGIAQKAS